MSGRWNPPEFLERAIDATGLSDFGEPDFSEPFSRLLQSYAEDVRFTPFGVSAYSSRLHMLLCNRLRITEDRKRNPAIGGESIERPIFITGLPRSGSSFLLDVLAQDPDNRVPRAWEIALSSPPPEAVTYDADPRIPQMQQLLQEQGYLDPDLLATHPFGATLPEECSFIIEQSFVSDNLASIVPARQYAEWLGTKADHRVAYRYHRRLLQNLQYRFKAKRWALKSPAHMFHLQALLDEYPDAIIVVTHRDVAKVLPSISSMTTAFQKEFLQGATVDPAALGANIRTLLMNGIRHTCEVRQRIDRLGQFCDVRYSELSRDPLGTVERIYSRFGIPLTQLARNAMASFVSRGAERHGHNRHRYALADYGLSIADIECDFGWYLDEYDVVRER